MIYFFHGTDAYRAKQSVDALKKKFIETYDTSGRNISQFYGDDFTLEDFFNAAKSTGFFAEKKFVIVKNLFLAKKLTEIQDPIIEYLKTLKNTTDEHYLLFWEEGNPRKNTKLYKFLHKTCSPKKCEREFKPLSGPELVNWIRSETVSYNKSILPDAAQLLVSLVGESTWALHNEIRKLCFSTDAEDIAAEHISQFISSQAPNNIFPFLDALGDKQTARALQLLDELIEADQEYLYLLAMIHRQFRLLVQTKESKRRIANTYALSKQLGLPSFIVQKLLGQSEKYTLKELSDRYEELTKLDRKLKSDPAHAKTALTMLVSHVR